MEEIIKILIVEDNLYDADLIQRELSRSHLRFKSFIVDSRKKYEEALNNNKPDLILSDYSLNAFDGITAYHIKEELLPGIPFIIISGSIGEENSIELIKIGITDCVFKDKLFSLIPKIERAFRDVESKRQKEKSDEKLRQQNKKLLEVAFLQSHEVRRPVANILGLINLIKFENVSDSDNLELIPKLKITATELEIVIDRILQKTEEIRAIQ